MIETEEQRRWWFATHPEYSWSRRGIKKGPAKGLPETKVDPKEVDAYVDKALAGLNGSIADLLRSVKRNFGTEGGVEDEQSRQQSKESAENSAKEAFITMQMNAGHSRERAEARWKAWKLNQGVGKSVDNAMLVHGAVTGSRVILGGVYRFAKSLNQVGAIGEVVGHGKWAVVGRRGGPSLEHQSRMSGKPIIERNGKYFIEEYRVEAKPTPVYYDDYRNGEFYEYKWDHSHLFYKNGEMKPWVEDPAQFRNEAIRQVGAAKGMPVIWRVGKHQVEAFRKAIGDVPGVLVKP